MAARATFSKFDPMWENQRPGLLLLNGIVYIGFASHGDNGPWHGWLLAYNAATLQQTSVFCTTPNGQGSGVWQGGAGLAADVPDPVNHPFGRMFVTTGNGTYDATTPYANGMDFGDDDPPVGPDQRRHHDSGFVHAYRTRRT